MTLPPSHIREVPVSEGAEAFIEVLNANGVQCIFINPGSDLVPILEALAKFRVEGRKAPEVILCQHEMLAMTAAHGYFMATEKPQVVLVHLDVGTLQVGGALHNAQRGYAGIIFCAGHAPWTFEGERRGGRFSSIDYRMEQFDQAAIVRQYVKWDFELRCNDNIAHIMQRAFQVANTEPHGPVYLKLPREVLMEKVNSVRILPPDRYGSALSPEGDRAALEEAARLLAGARNPLCITNSVGRHPEAVAPFVALCEALAMRVATPNLRMNLPTNHPLWAESNSHPYIKDTDAILVIDTQVPWAPSQVRPSPQAKVIHIDMDPIKATMPMTNFPADLRLLADSSKAVPVLLQMVRERLSAADRARITERMEDFRAEDKKRRARWEAAAQSKATQRPLASEWAAWCLGQEIRQADILVDEGIGYWTDTRRHIIRTLTGTTYHTDGCSLGWGLGSALGVKLAARDRTVICLTGDGSFIYAQPVPAIWAAASHQAPFLTVVFDNGGYRAMDSILDMMYGPGNYSSRLPNRVASRFVPPADYAAIGRACGAWGETVEDPADVRAAIRTGLQRVREGQPAVVTLKMARTGGGAA